MPYINIMNKTIYYNEHGSGEPIVFLNGMMMSTSSWAPFIRKISKNYRMITVDLLDQGKSDSYDGDYTIDTQVQILKGFLDKLKLEEIHLLGVSYGGKVAQGFTIKHQNKVKSLILSNTDSYTSNMMKDIGKGWDYGASTLDSSIFSSIVMPYMYSSNYYDKNYASMKDKENMFSMIMDEDWYHRFKRILNSTNSFNVTCQIRNIKIPTLIISSEFDAITPIKYQQLIHEQIEGSKWVVIKDIGHASMYEKPEEFISIILKFLGGICSL